MRIIGTPLRRLLIAVAIACAYNFAINAEIAHETALANATLFVLLPMFFVWWVQDDSRRTRYWPFYHYGLWLYVLGVVLVPHYVLRTRGRAGIPAAIAMFALAILPLGAAWLGILAFDYVPEALWIDE
jgi:hypothetical protein